MPDIQDPGFKVVESILLEHDAVPLFGGSPAFPFDDLCMQASTLFELQGLTGHYSSAQWRDTPAILDGMTTSSTPIDVLCGELEGRMTWLMNDQDWEQLMTWLLTKESTPWGIPDAGIREGFLKFSVAQALSLIQQSDFAPDLAFRMAEHSALPEEPAFTIDVTLEYQQQKVTGRLVISSSFHRAWSKKFAPRRPRNITPELAKSVDVDVHLELGSVELSQKEWYQLNHGDCLLLHTCNWDPSKHEGPVTLAVNGNALYQGTMNSKGEVKISQVASGTQDQL